MFIRKADRVGLTLWFMTAVIGFIALTQVVSWPWILQVLIALNAGTYLAMLVDKVQASQQGRRLSERSLYIMTVLGGAGGMLLAMYSLRHKTRKTSFQMVVALLILLQLLLVYYLTDFISFSL